MCPYSTSESSSTTSASSTASIVTLAEGEAATSETLGSNVLSVLGKGGKLLANRSNDLFDSDAADCTQG